MVKKLLRTMAGDLLIGAHESIAGGMHMAVERAERAGCRVLQVFTRNSNQWHARAPAAKDIENYKTALSKSRVRTVVAHDSYLINLCALNPVTLQKSREALVDEIHRCEALGIGLLNFHPGSHMGAGENDGIRLIIESLNAVHALTPGSTVLSVIETTAGQGTSIGYRFDHLKSIIDGVDDPERMRVCIDTCHVFAAGYDISIRRGYDAMMTEFERVIGFPRLAAIHVNDSLKPCGSRVDRHEHIGKGKIGTDGFRFLMQDDRLKSVPKILETPKGDDLREDIMNLRILRRLAGTRDF